MTFNPDILDRLPPQDMNAEQQVLGSVILYPPNLDDLGFLRAEDFYADTHRKLYAALAYLRDGNQAIDATLLCTYLRRAGDFEAVGGAAYIADILSAVPVAAHAKHYATIVVRMAKYRRLIHAAAECLRDGYEMDGEPEDILNRTEAALAAIGTGQYDGDPKMLSDFLIPAGEQIDAAYRRRERRGVSTGLHCVDETVGGLMPAELTILAARPSVGKTSLAMQIAYHIAGRGKLVYFASLEMTGTEIALRLICSLSGVSNRLIRTARLQQSDVTALTVASNQAAPARLAIHDRDGLSVQDIRRATRRLVKHDLGLVVVDYIGLVIPANEKDPRHEQVSKITRSLKRLSRELGVPVLALCQVNREGDKEGRLQLRHLRESGSIEQDADMVVFLERHEPETDESGNRENFNMLLNFAKVRNGATGDLHLQFEADATRFTDPNVADHHREFDGTF